MPAELNASGWRSSRPSARPRIDLTRRKTFDVQLLFSYCLCARDFARVNIECVSSYTECLVVDPNLILAFDSGFGKVLDFDSGHILDSNADPTLIFDSSIDPEKY
ncbi:hypothetical protein EVAR_87903_1 [Eumeta japonica]|uniref:Uncharacterized protein n=1 Tax=Eumeta variegata TaxID=151549 RepID=A0A4C1WVC5_EUMVA|nr:hypothetical protein EVAR_87903_1 [Eumeta japonica]